MLAFLEASKENPHDNMPRLMMADWLEECGDVSAWKGLHPG